MASDVSKAITDMQTKVLDNEVPEPQQDFNEPSKFSTFKDYLAVAKDHVSSAFTGKEPHLAMYEGRAVNTAVVGKDPSKYMGAEMPSYVENAATYDTEVSSELTGDGGVVADSTSSGLDAAIANVSLGEQAKAEGKCMAIPEATSAEALAETSAPTAVPTNLLAASGIQAPSVAEVSAKDDGLDM